MRLRLTENTASTEAAQDEQNDVVIAGERNLLEVSDFAQDMSQLRRAFNLFEQKTLLMRLLDETSQAAGIRIYIGGENQSTPLEEGVRRYVQDFLSKPDPYR